MKKKDMQSMVRLMLTPVLMVILGIVLVVRPDSAERHGLHHSKFHVSFENGHQTHHG